MSLFNPIPVTQSDHLFELVVDREIVAIPRDKWCMCVYVLAGIEYECVLACSRACPNQEELGAADAENKDARPRKRSDAPEALGLRCWLD